ncbi:MAG: hypothetical protein NTZ92_02050 [Candidatus Omnitrophica bacterium]|nr:hypothetical protein [Candidatus Omnitrophota bacterium]
MARKTVFALGIIISLSIVSASFAQDAAIPDAGQAATSAEFAATATAMSAVSPADSEMQWLWGEAVTVDAEKKEILVRYQDYDTDEEKEMTIAANDKTGFENVRSLAQIQSQDTLSIDYKVTADGKNTAKNISVEKAQDTGIEGAVQAAPATGAENVPAATSADIIPLQAAETAAAQAAQQ